MSPHESDWFSIIRPRCTNVFAHNVALWTLLFRFGLCLGILPSLYSLSVFFGSIVWVFSKGVGDGEVPVDFVFFFQINFNKIIVISYYLLFTGKKQKKKKNPLFVRAGTLYEGPKVVYKTSKFTIRICRLPTISHFISYSIWGGGVGAAKQWRVMPFIY